MSDTWIQTYGRRRLDLLNPDPADVDFRDVALGLARCARWAGQTVRRYSVAEHSLRVAEVARVACPEARLAALLHDAHEAYLGDWSTPLKRAIRDGLGDSQRGLVAICLLHDVEDGVREAIALRLRQAGAGRALGETEIARAVRHADRVLLHTEARDLLPGGPVDDWCAELPPPLEEKIGASHWDGLDDVAWAERWLAHVEDAAGLETGALVPLDLASARNWNCRPYRGVVVRARVWEVEG